MQFFLFQQTVSTLNMDDFVICLTAVGKDTIYYCELKKYMIEISEL